MLTPATPAQVDAAGSTSDRRPTPESGAGTSWKREMERAQAEMWLRQRALPAGTPRGPSVQHTAQQLVPGPVATSSAPDAPSSRPPDQAGQQAAASPTRATGSLAREPEVPVMSSDQARRALDDVDTANQAVAEAEPLAPHRRDGLVDAVHAPTSREAVAGARFVTGLTAEGPGTEGVEMHGSALPAIARHDRASSAAFLAGAYPASAHQPDNHASSLSPNGNGATAPGIEARLQSALKVAASDPGARLRSQAGALPTGPDQPLRVLATVQGTDVCVWLGMDAGVELNLEALLNRLRPIVERQGLRLARVVCNGATAFDASSAAMPTFNSGAHRP